MTSLTETLRSVFPEFEKARRERRKIRQRYRENIAAATGDGESEVVTINSTDYSVEYLSNWVEKKHIRADRLIKDTGGLMGNTRYRLPEGDSSEVVKAMKSVVWRITVRNWLSIFFEMIFIVFVVASLSAAVYLALAGIGTAISEISGVAGNISAILY